MQFDLSFKNIIIFSVTLIASIYDIRFRKIPNWLTFSIFFGAIIVNLLSFKMNLFLNSFFGGLLGILFLIVPYLTRTMGAGDVKLLGAIGAIVGYKDIILIFFYTATIGGVIGIIWLLFNPNRLKFLITTGHVLPEIDKKKKLPYGIAIFLGTMIYILLGQNNYSNNIPIWQLIQHL